MLNAYGFDQPGGRVKRIQIYVCKLANSKYINTSRLHHYFIFSTKQLLTSTSLDNSIIHKQYITINLQNTEVEFVFFYEIGLLEHLKLAV